MTKAYTRIYWSNSPDTTTPLGESTLLPMDASIDEIDDRVVTMDTTKADQTDLLQSLKSVEYDDETGEFLFTWWNGTTYTADLNIEKIPVSFSMSSAGVITMTTADGTTFTADVSELIKTYTFSASSEITFTTTTDSDGNKTVTAALVAGSITGDKLEPNYLANAQAAQDGAEAAETNAETAATLAESWAVGGTGTRTGEDTNNAQYWCEQAQTAAQGSAANISYDNTTSGLTADDVQDAIDELASEKQDALTAGTGIDITGSTISVDATASEIGYTGTIGSTAVTDVDGAIDALNDGLVQNTSDISVLNTTLTSKMAFFRGGVTTDGRYYTITFKTFTNRIPILIMHAYQYGGHIREPEIVCLMTDGYISTQSTTYVSQDEVYKIKIDNGSGAWANPIILYPANYVTITSG